MCSNLIKRAGRLTDAEFDDAMDNIEARHRENGERVARLENHSAYFEALMLSIDDIVLHLMSILGVKPGDEATTDTDEETGLAVFHAVGWDDPPAELRAEAEAVRVGALDDLRWKAVEWFSYMVDVWYLVVAFRDLGEPAESP